MCTFVQSQCNRVDEWTKICKHYMYMYESSTVVASSKQQVSSFLEILSVVGAIRSPACCKQSPQTANTPHNEQNEHTNTATHTHDDDEETTFPTVGLRCCCSGRIGTFGGARLIFCSCKCLRRCCNNERKRTEKDDNVFGRK